MSKKEKIADNNAFIIKNKTLKYVITNRDNRV